MQRPLQPFGPARPIVMVITGDPDRLGYARALVRWHKTVGQPPVEERYEGLTCDELLDVLGAVVWGAEPF